MKRPGLLETQGAIVRAVLGDEADDATALLDASPDGAARQLAIYRRAVTANLVGALRGAHPVVVRLVGDGFFHEAAKRFARGNPPACGDLNRFGERFGDFLATYAPAASMPWLADVARLDWACHEASMAGEGEPLDAARLAAVPEQAQGALRFAMHPSVRLLRSRWPVLAIWEANQPGRDGTPDRDEGEDIVLVWREAGDVRAVALEAPQAAFVEALVAGRCLEEAAGTADWGLPVYLATLATHGILGACRPEMPEAPGTISA